ncbi:hypothetical protein FRB95_014337 [Tulasnella sp. JGI-2019a]|nr:hypothetical protein FRB95_014337 [Tulasnella sp. JGI-2019a]
MSTPVQPTASGHFTSRVGSTSRSYPAQQLTREKPTHRSASMQELHSSSTGPRDDSFPSNFSSEHEASRGLLFAPTSGEQSMPSPMAIGKVCLIQAAGQGGSIPPPTAPRKEDFIKWEKKVIKKHWTHVKGAIEEHLGELPEEMSFPDLPPQSTPEKPLPSISEATSAQNHRRGSGSRQPLTISTGKPPKHHMILPSASSQSFQHAECQQAGSCQCSTTRGMTSAPANIPVFAMNAMPTRRRGSLPLSEIAPAAFVPYLPVAPSRQQGDPLTARPGFIPTAADMARAIASDGKAAYPLGVAPSGGHPQGMQAWPVGIPGGYMIY